MASSPSATRVTYRSAHSHYGTLASGRRSITIQLDSPLYANQAVVARPSAAGLQQGFDQMKQAYKSIQYFYDLGFATSTSGHRRRSAR